MLVFSLFLFSTSIAKLAALTILLAFREGVIHQFESVQRIDSGFSEEEESARQDWRFNTRRLLLTQKQRVNLCYAVGALIGVAGIPFVSTLTVTPAILLGALGTVGLGILLGVCISVAAFIYIKDADPSSRQSWKTSREYFELYAKYFKSLGYNYEDVVGKK